jgi:signal transduction histidine kinase
MKTKRKGIIVYYALAIVLPCLILGILAFRGLKNDQALVEREQRRALLEVGQQIILDTEAYLTSIETGFIEIIDTFPGPKETIFTDSLLNQFNAHHQTIAGIFFISGDNSPVLLNNGLLYVPDDFLSASNANGFQSTQNILEKGWQFEFREKDYAKALTYYQSIMSDGAEEQSAGEILNAIARIQKKLALDNEAIASYDLIWNHYPQVYIQNKIPLGAVALLEKSLLHLQSTDTVSALKTAYFLMSQFQIPMWEIRYSHLSNFISKIEDIILLCESTRDEEAGRWLQRNHTMIDSLSHAAKQTEYLLAFQAINEKVFGITEPFSENTISRYNTRINGIPYFFSLMPGNDKGQWGIIIDRRHMLNNKIQYLILDKADKTNFYWKITGENGEELLESDYIPVDIPPVYAVFPSNLPLLSLALYPEDSGLLSTLFRPGEGLFFYIFLVIVIILAFGLFFTLQTINNEMHLSRMKSQFMSTVSHEFKSPLTSIRQMAEMLVHGRVASTEKQQKYYDTILQQSERLSHLIENILDFSKIEEGQKVFRFEDADIVPLVSDIVGSFQEHTADEGFQISLEISEPIPHVYFDREAMEQVIHNLMDNACKYSGDAKTIEVCLFPKGNKVIFSVRDYGIGIRKEDHEKIFSRFYRAGEELTQSVKGSGIGLTIVKQIVDAHHGDITVESNPDKGSIFTVMLPVSSK